MKTNLLNESFISSQSDSGAQKMRNPILVQSHNLQKVSESAYVNFFSINKNVGID